MDRESKMTGSEVNNNWELARGSRHEREKGRVIVGNTIDEHTDTLVSLQVNTQQHQRYPIAHALTHTPIYR